MARARSTSRAAKRSFSPSSPVAPVAERVSTTFPGTFYPAEVDGAAAAFVVDLEQEPRATHATRIEVAVTMTDPESDGLRSAAEMEELDALQEKLTAVLARKFGAVCVGFFDLRGVATYVYYAKKKPTDDEVVAAMNALVPYEVEVTVDHDPEWRFYIDALFPDAYALQGILNRAVVDELAAHGDALEEPRDVDHVVTFPEHAKAQKAAKKLAAAFFEIDGIGDAEEEGRTALAFHRLETLEGDRPDLFSKEILDIVLPLEGEYDGWGAPAVARAKPRKKASPAPKKKQAAPRKKASPAPKKKQAAPRKKASPAPKKKQAAPRKKADARRR